MIEKDGKLKTANNEFSDVEKSLEEILTAIETSDPLEIKVGARKSNNCFEIFF